MATGVNGRFQLPGFLFPGMGIICQARMQPDPWPLSPVPSSTGPLWYRHPIRRLLARIPGLRVVIPLGPECLLLSAIWIPDVIFLRARASVAPNGCGG